MSLSPELKTRIDEIVASDEVVLFMKGNQNFPQCGFSATVVQILNSYVPKYTTINVLSDPAIRQGIKDYSDWPTIPQLYIKGEFVGGCDIIKSMHESGDLQSAIGADLGPMPEPTITITDSAATALKDAIGGADAGDVVHLSIDPSYNHGLDLAPAVANAVQLTVNGVAVNIDRMSAGRAEGVSIDFVDGPQGAGFKIENPSRPPSVAQISPAELKGKLDAKEVTELFDVRTDREVAIATIEGARQLDDETMAYIEGLDKDTPLAFHCHHGRRSQAAAEHFLKQGFKTIYNLAGGIDAWAQEVDPSVKRY
jgi:monothiol glutaredoxin